MAGTWEIEGRRPAWLKLYMLFSVLACLTWAHDLYHFLRWYVLMGRLDFDMFDPSLFRNFLIFFGLLAVYATAAFHAFKRPSAIALCVIVSLALWLASRLPEELSVLYQAPEYVDEVRQARGVVLSLLQIVSTVLLVRGHWINEMRSRSENSNAVD